MSTTKAIALVDNKIDYMLQRQIVKSLDNQIDVEDPGRRKYAITRIYLIAWIFISINVTLYRTAPLQRCQSSNSHWILLTTKLRSRSI